MAQLFYEDPLEVEHCVVVYDHVHAAALSVPDSRAFLENLISP
jgi:hypothetical protein